ncbi:1-deoxy-D-xylulose 5-phosphate reductoisomerase [Arenicella chitinivorans]|uniref:1-deoxy-D-xylulose 5-phosphate reductoisomerase n=1 Tax=Arenicella chitinivorans TaxID=1329800 RepID=A0A918RLD0_9GAMM|nr:1-deoxy-D-xylulose-5-phosphate reductoisomerase [Arenicella chitinivorans]GHA00928.1 1-deoxy-D-xylulose 5-phosphate reductoisomerase [Arenicella chitinivorans]
MTDTKQSLVILGSTGSVGQSTLKVIQLHPEKYDVVGLTANTNVNDMLAQCRQFKPQTVVMTEAQSAAELSLLLAQHGMSDITVESGADALTKLAAESAVSTVMSAIVGAAGLEPTLAAVRAGKRVLIANKEPLVMTGDLFMREAEASGAVILPIDSEHNAIFQCLPEDQSQRAVRKIHLTASGGPFRGRPWSDLQNITPDQACAHPNWSMGRKISVDSATMMNKGLELIEAAALFQISARKVEILIHPQSIIHSMVEYVDGSFLAQLGAPDMCIPIAHALAWPDRIRSGAETLDLAAIAQLDFHTPDMTNLPCLRLAREAADAGQSAPAILNAANEVAVDAFLQKKIRFTDIASVVADTLTAMPVTPVNSLENVLNIDNEARRVACASLESRLI